MIYKWAPQPWQAVVRVSRRYSLRLFQLQGTIRRIGREFTKFGTVGAVAYLIDVGAFNVLRYAGGDGLLHDKPLTAKTVSVVLATTFAYFGNRHWTFRHRHRSGFGREYPLFFMLNGIALVIALACLATSHYVLGFTSPVADNIAANVVGVGLGTIFRFWSYRRWVFREFSSTTSNGATRHANTSRALPPT